MPIAGSARIPGALDMTWRSPPGTTTASPGPSRIALAGSSASAAQHCPSSTMWKKTTCSNPGITRPPTLAAAGLSATHGARALMSK